MSAAMKPTVGRIVWFWLGSETEMPRDIEGRAPRRMSVDQPFAAQVVFVYDGPHEPLVNLLITDHVGRQFRFHGVDLRAPLVNGGGIHNVADHHGAQPRCYATWPYQAGPKVAAA